jgi:tetratricopeptide (TPR) repeat protein
MLFKLGLLLSWDFNRLPPNQALLAFQHCSQAAAGGGGSSNSSNTAAAAMCYWGQAYSLGPYLNAVPGTGEEPWPIFSPQMMQQAHEAATTAYRLAQQALHDAVAEEQKEEEEEDSSIYKKKKNTTLRQQLQQQVAYTKAAVDRYNPTTHSPPPSRNAAETEYGQSMESIGDAYADPTAYALAAEAWLNIVPWDFDFDDDKSVGGGSGGRSYYNNNSNSNKLRKEVVKAVELINKALYIYPEHPLALHLGVHIAEIGDAETKEKEDSRDTTTITNTLTKSSNATSWGEMCADRLYNLHPRMGHLQHMPSHVYIRVGRWHDAVKVNIHGAYVADVENTLGDGGSGYGGNGSSVTNNNNNNSNMYTKSGDRSSNCLNAYLPEHNLQMLVFAASMSGEYEVLKHWADDKMYHLREEVGEEAAWPGRERTYLMLEHVRRGMWEEVMMTRGPKWYERGPGAAPGGFEYAQGVWHFGRCMATAGQAVADDDGSSSVVQSLLRQAKKERQKLDEIAASLPPDIHTTPGRGVGIYSPGYNDLMKIMQLVADARLATLKKEEDKEEEEGGRKMNQMIQMMTSRKERWAAAAILLEEAVKVEEAQGYTEPPRLVGAPTRHCWGYALLQSGSNSITVVEKAVEVYEEGLRRYPGDGWALLGLGQALKKVRGREKESIAALDAADEAFKYADIKPKISCPSLSL